MGRITSQHLPVVTTSQFTTCCYITSLRTPHHTTSRDLLHHRHQCTTETQPATTKRNGHRTDWSPCPHSIGKFFLWLIVFSLFETSARGLPGSTCMTILDDLCLDWKWPLWVLFTMLAGTAFCPSNICALQNTMVTPPRPVPKAPNHWLLACAECEACEERVPGCRAWSPNLSNLRERENRKNRKQERERLYGYSLCVGGLCECLKVYPT